MVCIFSIQNMYIDILNKKTSLTPSILCSLTHSALQCFKKLTLRKHFNALNGPRRFKFKMIFISFVNLGVVQNSEQVKLYL